MASNESSRASAAARERGNALYRQNLLTAAEKEYRKAKELAPSDPAPLANLSALYFEEGRYSEAVSLAQEALALSSPATGPTSAPPQKLQTRLAKASLFSSDWKTASAALEKIVDKAQQDELRTVLQDIESLQSLSPEVSPHREDIFDRLPRYKASLQDVAEYYAVGHDSAESLLEESLMHYRASNANISLMFCGSGDARHLFVTLADEISAKLVSGNQPPTIHITILDLKAAALARTLLLFDMMIAFIAMKTTGTPGYEDIPVAVAYLFAGLVLPPWVVRKLQAHIAALADSLGGSGQPYDWIYIDSNTQELITKVLKQWQQPMPAQYTARNLRKAVKTNLAMSQEQARAAFGIPGPQTPQGCEADREVFDDLTILLGSRELVERKEPALSPLVTAYRAGKPGSRARLDKYINDNWTLNPTLIDIDYEARRVADTEDPPSSFSDEERRKIHEMESIPPIEFDPFQLLDSLSDISYEPPCQPGLLSLLGAKFAVVSLAIMVMTAKELLMLEILVGEMTDVMERMRYGLLRSRDDAQLGQIEIDTAAFPTEYDRIHMSNIPDYVGGLFGTFMYARPLLREKSNANLRFNNLLNPPMFASHKKFQSEYLLMHDKKRIADHFFVHRQAGGAGMPDFMGGGSDDMSDMMSFMTENYYIWESIPLTRLSWDRLLPRPTFEHWMYSHLLKLCIPSPRPIASDQPVMAPLNLTAFARLVAHTALLGYPAHWLSALVVASCQGSITTTARVPQDIVVSPEDADRLYPSLKLSLAPFRAEISTVFGIWRRIISSPIMSPPGAIPALTQIRQYSVMFPPISAMNLIHKRFVLVFWDRGLTGSGSSSLLSGEGLFDLLRNHEGRQRQSSDSKLQARIRDTGMHIVTTFKYVSDSRTATFWLREDVVRNMSNGDWVVGVWRTDTWEQVTGMVSVSQLEGRHSWDTT